MGTTIAAPSSSDVQIWMDNAASLLKAAYAAMGLGAPGEAGTVAAKAISGRTAVFGDGSTAYGIQNAILKQKGIATWNYLCVSTRWDAFFALGPRQLCTDMDYTILQSLPSRTSTDGWKFTGGPRGLDAYLTRLNCNDTVNTPATPSWTPTLTATTGGQIAATTGGAEPRVKVTYVGSADYYESQPSTAATQVALSGKNNAWTLGGMPGTVPTGVTKLRIYRQLDNNSGAGAAFYWDKDVAVTAGSAFPAITLTNSDVMLRQDWGPPVWMGLAMLPEAAALYALALAAPPTTAGQQGNLFTFSSSAFLTAFNVALNASNAFLGMNNPVSSAEFARRIVGTGFTQGAIQTANDATQVLQGFSGAWNSVRARVVTALNVDASLTNIGYKYYDAANFPTLQTGNIAGALTLVKTLGSVVDLVIPAGRIVTQITGDTCGGSASGTYVYEAVALRSI